MTQARLIVTASKADGALTSEPDVLEFQDELQGADPLIVTLTGDHMFDLYTLHCFVKLKIEMLGVSKLDLNLRSPYRLGHAINTKTGKWTDVDSTVAIVYSVEDSDDLDRRLFMGVHADTSRL